MPTRKQLILLVIVAITVMLISAPLYLFKKRSSLYPYEVSRDYKYEFRGTEAQITELRLINAKVNVANRGNTNQTAFLRVNVNSTFVGKYFQPSIEITGATTSIVEYVEHGAKGVRYLNISSLLSRDGGAIRLKGRHVSINDQSVQLIVFDNHDTSHSRVLVLAPHPDDAEIAAYGLYSSNNGSYIVTVTAGDGEPNTYDEIFQDKVKGLLKKGQLRTWNSITVPLLGGIPFEQSINLGFFDGTLELMHKDKSSAVRGLHTFTQDIATYRQQNISSLAGGLRGKSDWISLVENLEYLLVQIRPDIIVAPYPALDSHRDHKFSSIALFEAIRLTGMKKGVLFLYTNHFVLTQLYPYGAASGSVTLPPNFGSPVNFDSIYSQPLSSDHQKDKVLALESMNDLRLDTEWRSSKGAISLAIESIKRDLFGDDFSYFRRAVRSNELFFVIEVKSIYDEQILKNIVGEL